MNTKLSEGGPVGIPPIDELTATRFLASIVESSDDAILSKTLMGIIQSWNHGAEKIFGYSAEEAIGKHITLIIPPFRADEENQIIARICAGERIEHFETVRRRKDGTLIQVSITVSPIRDELGKVVAVSKIARDVTKQKKFEDTLRYSEQLHRVAFDLAPTGMAYVELSGRFSKVNGRLCEITGYTEFELLSMEAVQLLSPHESMNVVQPFKQFLSGTVYQYKGECQFLRKDGKQRWCVLSGQLVTDRDGSILHSILVIADITERKQAESELKKAHQKLETVLDSITDGLLVLDKDWRYVYFNNQGARLIGVPVDSLIGKCVWDLFPHARTSKFYEAYHEAVATNKEVHFVEFYPEPINKWLRCHCYPSNEGLSVYFQDVTEQRQAEAITQQNATLFATLIEQAPLGVYVIDSQFRLQQVNSEAMPSLNHVSPILGRDFKEVLCGLWGPEIGQQITAVFQRTLETGERYVSPLFTEKRFDLGEEEAYEWETQRITLPDGKYGVVCYFRDVTARTRAARALAASEERIRLATETTGVGIWEWNILTGELSWDAQMFRIYGVEPTPELKLNYQTWSTAVVPEDLPAQEQLLNQLITTLEENRREFRILRKDDGQLRYIQSVETIRKNSSGEPEWMVGTNLDVTERKLAEEALKDADRRKDEFLATLAHELRNPLAPLSNGLQVMRHARDDKETMDDVQAMMERQLGQMVRLVNDLMEMSRISQGKLEIRKSRIELKTVLEYAMESSQPIITQAGQTLSISIPTSPIVLDADLTRLSQVFLNLLNNAAKYSNKGDHIDISAIRSGDEVSVSVKDTGIGIALEYLPRVFEMFSQIDGSLEKAQGGLGIGLTLVKKIVEIHGGRVEAKSEGLGKGCEFIVHLPVLAE